jgi:ABC-2 type transport system ATP-binding protein
MAAIRTHGLTRDFSTVRALDRLTLEVPRGSVFGFLGRNGAGKTTTIRLLLGLLEPTSGGATVMGFDCFSQSMEVRKRCGVLLEQHGLIERISAIDNLELYGRIWRIPRKIRRARVRELLERVDLWERRKEKVRTWSRGMKQKLAIARALVHRPAVLFLDEPTAGLDPVAAASLRDDLLTLAERERVTVFLNTHYLTEAEKLCDILGIIRDGRLLALGSPEELRRQGARRWVRVTGSGFSDTVLEIVRSRPEVSWLSREEDCLLVDFQDECRAAPIVRLLVRLGAEIEEVRQVDNTLEDAFHSLMNGEVPPSGSWLVKAG